MLCIESKSPPMCCEFEMEFANWFHGLNKSWPLEQQKSITVSSLTKR